MVGTGDGGGEYHLLDGFQRLLLDVITTKMQRLLNHNNEELYGRIKGSENQLNSNAGRHYGGNRGGNDGPRQNRMEGQNRIKGVKLNVPFFEGRSDPNTYLDWEMKLSTYSPAMIILKSKK